MVQPDTTAARLRRSLYSLILKIKAPWLFDLELSPGLRLAKLGWDSGPGQTSAGKRRANHVEVRFTFDRWEATSNLAFSLWLCRRQSVASLLRVGGVEQADGQLRLTGTGIAIALAFKNLKLRDYSPTKKIRKRRTISI
jgi:hypothetical protein